MRRQLIAIGAGVLTALVVLALALGLNWSGSTTLIVGAVCAFVFSMIAAPLALSRPRRSSYSGATHEGTIIISSTQRTEGPPMRVRSNGQTLAG
jgi:hypothetical protein